ncbi:hypothetical protein PINS_up005683 [Pythium insidiosum]|nr:hypothetical protein PINS_up005683 [Pythium insidiosum]
MVFLIVHLHALWSCFHAIRVATPHVSSSPRKRRGREYEEDGCSTSLVVTTVQVPGHMAPRHWKRRRVGPHNREFDRCTRRQRVFELRVLLPLGLYARLTQLRTAVRSGATHMTSHPVMQQLAEKLQDAAQRALEELLSSVLSFLICAVVVLVLRSHSSLVTGVSVDLGAFSLDM